MEITNLDLQNQINSMKTTILQTIYPVGSIYITLNEKSPREILGIGTWERIEDRFLLGVGSSNEAIDTDINHKGGSFSHQHNLHAGNEDDGCTAIARLDFGNVNMLFDLTSDGVPFVPTVSLGHSQTPGTSNMDLRSQAIALDGYTGTGANIPPYLTVYMWKRIS